MTIIITNVIAAKKPSWTQGRGDGRGGRGAGRGGRGVRGNERPEPGMGGERGAGRGAFGGRGGGRGGKVGGRFAGRGRSRYDRKMDRQPSLTVQGDWVVVEEFDLPQLLKLQANNPTTEDLMWAGHLDQYDETYDRIDTKNAKPLQRIENKIFYYVSTQDDSVIQDFAMKEAGNVYATDAILALLMASTRSVFSWDIVIEKYQGVLFMDKRENSTFDFLTVSETAHDPPSASEDTEEINHPEKLSLEATAINQNFSQQILKESPDTRDTFEPHPFFVAEEDDDGVPASVAYRYRKFTLGNIKVVARCELHGWAAKGKDKLKFTTYALNEWDSRYSGGIDWRRKIDTQRGAVLATELKNNSCKLAKWTAQSVLAGADLMRVGYVSRLSRSNGYEHSILATQVFKPKDLSQQINLSTQNMWGIVKMICELMMKQEDGKFVLMKDPNKATVRLYMVPPDSFVEEEEEEEAGEEDGEGGSDEDSDSEPVSTLAPSLTTITPTPLS